jgi:hypothetical protein
MRSAFLFFVLLGTCRADTLEFRNGNTLTGKFLSIDATLVSFIIDGEVKSYARSQVLKITFSSAEKITAGQTIDQVTTLLGQPTRIVDVGAKKVYIYSGFKITFVDGKVTVVE